MVSDSSVYYSKLAIALSQKTNYPKGEAKGCYIIGTWERRNQNYFECRPYYEKAIKICKTHHFDKLLYRTYRRYIDSYSYTAQVDSVMQFSRQAIAYFESRDAPQYIGIFYQLMGNEKLGYADYDSSIDFYGEALRYFELSDDIQGMSGIYNNMAVIYKKMGRKEEAMKEYKKVLEISKKHEVKDMIRYVNYNIGNLFLVNNQLDSALQYLHRAEELYLVAKNPIKEKVAQNYSTLGKTYIDLGQAQKALGYLNKAYVLFKDSPNSLSKCYLFTQFADAYEKLNKIDLAESNWKKAIAKISALNHPQDELIFMKRASEFHERNGQPVKALEEFKIYNFIADSLVKINQNKKVDELLTQYQTAEKDKEISLLAKDNEMQTLQIQQQQRNLWMGLIGTIFFLGIATLLFFQRQKLKSTKEKLEVSVKEKETLLKEIHHRVKNNLQLVTSLLNIQAEKETPQTIEEFLIEGQNRVKSMALIHEQLYRSENISSINMQEYFEKLVKSIIDIHGNQSITYQIQTENNHLDIDKAIPLGLIINELVNNSLKHAFTNKGTGNLQVQMKENAQMLEVNIKDDGIGFASDTTKNSIGLQLVEILTKQLRGSFEFLHQAGTKATIVFPKS